MRDLAIRDGLTGIFNRRFALEQLAAALAYGAAAGERVAVALLDVDFAKTGQRPARPPGRRRRARHRQGAGRRLRGNDLVGR
ncbi:MAG: diguanylate cyclase [Myxococcales bacterium]|nr:diguanylate cyclase [Myxococcales bacterium]